LTALTTTSNSPPAETTRVGTARQHGCAHAVADRGSAHQAAGKDLHLIAGGEGDAADRARGNNLNDDVGGDGRIEQIAGPDRQDRAGRERRGGDGVTAEKLERAALGDIDAVRGAA
jgi:hypothetical protein